MRRKEDAKAFKERFDQQCHRLRKLEDRVNTLLNRLHTDTPNNNNQEKNGLEELEPSASPTIVYSPDDFLPLTQNNSPLAAKQEDCLSAEQIQMISTGHPSPFQTANIPSRATSQDEDWSKLLEVLPHFDDNI